MGIIRTIAKWFRHEQPRTGAPNTENENPYTREDLVRKLQYLATGLGCYVAVDQNRSPIRIRAFRYKPELAYDPEDGEFYWKHTGHCAYWTNITKLVPIKLLEFVESQDYKRLYCPEPGPEHRVKTTMTTRPITLGLQLNTDGGLTACIDNTGIKGSHKKIAPNYMGAKVPLNDLAKAFSVRDLEDMLAYRRTQLGTK